MMGLVNAIVFPRPPSTETSPVPQGIYETQGTGRVPCFVRARPYCVTDTQ